MINEEAVKKALITLKKYMDGSKNLRERIKTNEQWYKQRHWDLIRDENHNGAHPEPTSGYLFNCIANKHADAMDNYPDCSILPREPSDAETAKILSDVLPVVLDHNNFERTYSDLWYTKLRQGTGIYGVFWDNAKENGLGDVSIKSIDVLNFYFEPGIKDIQDSKNIFLTTLVDNDELKSVYQITDEALGSDKSLKIEYAYDDNIDAAEKSVVVDWYYKKRIGTKSILHFAKFVGDNLLYASENDEAYAENGWYEHGKYPFVLDGLFPVEGTPFCFGYVDICKSPQMYIDKLDQLVIENAYRTGKVRYFVSNQAGINEKIFANWNEPLIKCDSVNDIDSKIKEMITRPLDSTVLNARGLKVDELKETSGNRDFSQGGTTSGITAASAIAALQEAGSKLSRDMIKASYGAFTTVCELSIELMRQFYTESRCFRITRENATEFVNFDNSSIASSKTGISERKPIFDIEVVAQKKSPFNRVAQNEMIKELYGAGFFNPQNAEMALIALSAMDFEGKNQLEEQIRSNAQSQQKAQMLDSLMSVFPNETQAMLEQSAQADFQSPIPETESVNNSDLARAVRSAGTLADKARESAQSQAEVNL